MTIIQWPHCKHMALFHAVANRKLAPQPNKEMMTSSNCQAPLSLTQSGSEIFRKAVTYILTEWPSLSLAIDNGMGGAQAREKRNWMCQAIAEVVIKNKDVDLEDYLAEMVNQEFDTLVEDGSLEYNAKWIEKFYKDCLQGKEQDVLNSINQASIKKISLGNMKIPAPVCQQDSDDDDDDEDEDEDDDEEMS